jgi:YHS domain-containing protein
MMELLSRLLEFIVIVSLVRFVMRHLLSGGNRGHGFGQAFTSQTSSQSSPEPAVSGGEMKKDPQCGTYVATELSIKHRQGGEILHFCSPECKEEFTRAQSRKPA